MRFLLLFISTFFALSVLAEDIYSIDKEYIAPNNSLSTRLAIDNERGYVYALNSDTSLEGSVIFFYKRSESGDYLFQKRIIPTEPISGAGLEIIDNQLIAFESNEVHYYQIEANGNLSYLKTENITSEVGYSGFTKVTAKLANQSYLAVTNTNAYLFTIDTDTSSFNLLSRIQITASDNISAYFDDVSQSFFIPLISGLTYQFKQYSVANDTISELQTFSYRFPDTFDYYNEGSIYFFQYDHVSQQIFARNDQRAFLFQLNLDNASMGLVFNEDKSNFMLRGSANFNSYHFASNGSRLFVGQFDWQTQQLNYTEVSHGLEYARYRFISANLVVGTSSVSGKAELFNFDSGVLSKRNERFTSSLNAFFPKKLIDSYLDRATGTFLILGGVENLGGGDIRLYNWHYSEADNELNPVDSILVLGEEEQTNTVNYDIIGQIANRYYVLVRSNRDLSSRLFVFELVDSQLQKIQEYAFSSWINLLPYASVVIDSETIMFREFTTDIEPLGYMLCKLSTNGTIQNCESKQLLDGLVLGQSSNNFDIVKLENSNNLFMRPDRVSSESTSAASTLWVLEYDATENMLLEKQSIELPPMTQGSVYQINSLFTFDDGNKLYIRTNRPQFYERNPADGSWIEVESESYITNAPNPMFTSQKNYAISESGRSIVMDLEKLGIYNSQQTRNAGSSESIYQVTDNDKVLILTVDTQTSFLVTSLNNMTPTVYKERSDDLEDVEALQDVPLTIDVGSLFINPSFDEIDISVNGIDPLSPDDAKFQWDGKVLTILLGNEDMFYNEYDLTPANDIRIAIHYNNRTIDRFMVTPINVNDAPALIDDIETQYLKAGESYVGHLLEVVKDPDRESITFSYDNLPSGLSGTPSGEIQGSINRSGTYVVSVTASDDEGASLQFSFTIVVTADGTPPTEQNSSSGGGGSLPFYLLFLLLSVAIHRRYPHNKI
ncbi:hypothetical protein KUL42_37900 [Alteromonas sp. KUL42]|uniref:Ig domain-containing protein n=1 Tax=Alteromonas sp. KUL42 TaxID=2480797 RepID=UPI001036EB4A|nr:Ig domain-containing protein [Alteromonas sp. KUL42]TAP32049.1 hypothetical protein EYR97_18730 [Alteromonas sp. KUL42]GEA09029.1 hypothetical protein KUL42_37900 [Alteromonas sp. KUL42]